MLTNVYRRVPLDRIVIDRDARQRREIDTKGLRESIARIGVMQPIIIDRDFRLIAGERRYTASKELGLKDIPARFTDELSVIDQKVLELEENIKRVDLSWTEQSKAVCQIHELYCAMNERWSQEDTADAIGVTKGWLSMLLGVGREVIKDNPRIKNATSARMAHNALQREKTRRDEHQLQELVESILPEDAVPKPRATESIICADFTEWVRDYDGIPFNFIHCDFPYGVNLHDSDQARSESWGAYDDKPETYWNLLKVLANNQHRIASPSAHMVFWFSMKFYCDTLSFFSHFMPEWEVNRFPLIWDKTDNKGILPDPRRGPRQTYESAFILARGDRHIVKAVKNSYGCPTTKVIHQSEKPEPMLRHFFTMFIDEYSRVLDPTCGSGTALRAAESLGAAYVLGLERDPTYADAAAAELRKFRSLRGVSK